jgi:putative restriction endonuclease
MVNPDRGHPVQHYVVYHNVQNIGSEFDDDSPVQHYAITTNKSVRRIPGSIMWVISGEGARQKEYRLRYWFVADMVDPNREVNGSPNEVKGTDGYTFRGGVRLNDLPWFPTLKAKQNRFSLGMQKLDDESVRHLYATTRAAGGRTPTDEYLDPQPFPAELLSGPVGPEISSIDSGPAPRRDTYGERLVRDTALTVQVKRLYDHHCQICGTQLSTPKGPYSEAAHIQPLGAPHNGPDVFENLLCLCPNHHALFDKGAFRIHDDLKLVWTPEQPGAPDRLRIRDGHFPGTSFFAYHRQWFEATDGQSLGEQYLSTPAALPGENPS